MAAANLHPAAGLQPSPALLLHRLVPWMYTLVLVLLVAALARPQWGVQGLPAHTSGVDIILAVDLSESMAAMDFRQGDRIINRLEAVKGVVADFIARRGGDRIGMVVFGSRAYTQMPLTHDHAALTGALEHLGIGAAGRATAIGDAVGISLKRLQDARGRSRVIVMLTDGASNSGALEPLEAAEIARQMGVKIHAIGVGRPGRAPFLVDDPIFGPRTVYRQADLDEATLQTVADRTGGRFFRANDLEGLREISRTIDAMEKTEDTIDRFARYDELYIYLLLPAFGLLGLWVVLKNTRFLAIP
jgi:Ca-activated chloride channel homolog